MTVVNLTARRAQRLKQDLQAARARGDVEAVKERAKELLALGVFAFESRASRQEPAPGGVVADVRASAPNFFGGDAA